MIMRRMAVTGTPVFCGKLRHRTVVIEPRHRGEIAGIQASWRSLWR
jgi:hypothetical protein